MKRVLIIVGLIIVYIALLILGVITWTFVILPFVIGLALYSIVLGVAYFIYKIKEK